MTRLPGFQNHKRPTSTAVSIDYLDTQSRYAPDDIPKPARVVRVAQPADSTTRNSGHDPDANVETNIPSKSVVSRSSGRSTRKLRKGERVYVWVNKKYGRPGRHFAPPGTDPKTLAIDDDRDLEVYEVDEDLEVIESTADDIGKVADGVGGKGGGQQLIMPPNRNGKLRKIQ